MLSPHPCSLKDSYNQSPSVCIWILTSENQGYCLQQQQNSITTRFFLLQERWWLYWMIKMPIGGKDQIIGENYIRNYISSHINKNWIRISTGGSGVLSCLMLDIGLLKMIWGGVFSRICIRSRPDYLILADESELKSQIFTDLGFWLFIQSLTD